MQINCYNSSRMTNLSESKVRSFQKKILFWYEKNKRELPWRELLFDVTLQQRDPYKILVSEVMAQQTQIARVIPKYHAWLTRFPTLQSLAEAPTREVLLYWSGLGYNRRALNLQKAAQVIVREYQGEFPRSVETLRKLPGIGQYTASAIACFAFNEQIAVIDTNVRKVILIEILKKKRRQRKKKLKQSLVKYFQRGWRMTGIRR